MKWIKQPFFECNHKYIFLDELGFCSRPKVNITSFVLTIKNQEYNLRDVYRKNEEGKYVNLGMYLDNITEILFKEPLYLPISVIECKYSRINLKSVKLCLNVPTVTSEVDAKSEVKAWPKLTYEKVFKSAQDIEEFEIYTTDTSPAKIKYLSLGIEKGDECFLLGVGKCTVMETNDSLTKDIPLCVVKTKNDELVEIYYGEKKLMKLPEFEEVLATPSREQNFIHKEYNIDKLRPYCENDGNGYCLFIWKPIKEAKKYTIDIYRLVKNEGEEQLYLMTSKNIDGNKVENFYRMPIEYFANLGDNLLYRFIAKKDKKILAFSKGLPLIK